MAADWDWCSTPPAMADEQDKADFARWRKWFMHRTFDTLVNPITEISLALQELEKTEFTTEEQRERVREAMEGYAALEKAFSGLRAGIRKEKQEDWK